MCPVANHLKQKTDREFIENEIREIRQMSLEKFIYRPEQIVNLNYGNLQFRALTENLTSEQLKNGDGQVLEVNAESTTEVKLEYALSVMR